MLPVILKLKLATAAAVGLAASAGPVPVSAAALAMTVVEHHATTARSGIEPDQQRRQQRARVRLPRGGWREPRDRCHTPGRWRDGAVAVICDAGRRATSAQYGW